MEVFPGDDMSLDEIRRLVDELSANGLIDYFEADDVEYWFVTGWSHQKIEKPNNKHPNPLDYNHSPISRRLVVEESTTILPRKYKGCIKDVYGKGEDSRGEEGIAESAKGRFDDFWSIYPSSKKIGKKVCRDIWQRRKLDQQADEIINGLNQWLTNPSWVKDGGQFVPNPQTFLNQNRWEDMQAAMTIAPVTNPKKSFAQAGEDAANYFLNQKKD